MIFENSFGELVDVVIENGSFSFNKSSKKTISDCTKVGEFLAQDVFDILMNEKPGLKDYDSIKVIRIIESFWWYCFFFALCSRFHWCFFNTFIFINIFKFIR